MQTTDLIKQFIATELLSSTYPSMLGDMEPLIALIEKGFGIRLTSSELMLEYFDNIKVITRLVGNKPMKPGSTR